MVKNYDDESFNSKMVRLKGLKKGGKGGGTGLFQFQNGAIKRLGDLEFLVLQQRFNSKMVRLKVAGVAPHLHGFLFQFQNGAIKSFAIHQSYCRLGSFNSKMVRLKVPRPLG